MNNNLLLCVNGGHFDYCIMDESHQMSEPLALGPILLSDKFIMLGDFKNASGPNVKSQFAEKKGLGISLFERLCRYRPESVTTLQKPQKLRKNPNPMLTTEL